VNHFDFGEHWAPTDRLYQVLADKSPLTGVWSGSCNPLSLLSPPNDISGRAKARIVKFCIQVECIKYYLLDDEQPLKGVVRVTWPIFNFDSHDHISENVEARVVNFFMLVEYIKC